MNTKVLIKECELKYPKGTKFISCLEKSYQWLISTGVFWYDPDFNAVVNYEEGGWVWQKGNWAKKEEVGVKQVFYEIY